MELNFFSNIQNLNINKEDDSIQYSNTLQDINNIEYPKNTGAINMNLEIILELLQYSTKITRSVSFTCSGSITYTKSEPDKVVTPFYPIYYVEKLRTYLLQNIPLLQNFVFETSDEVLIGYNNNIISVIFVN
jgi:hypothetical protein